MIENQDTIKYIKEYFNSIKNSLPYNCKFDSAYKYNNQTNHNTDEEPLNNTDNIVVYYTCGRDNKRSSFKISNSTVISYLRNKKLEQLGI
jgi:hypothetical protein